VGDQLLLDEVAGLLLEFFEFGGQFEFQRRFSSNCHVVSDHIAMSFLVGMDGANEPRHLDRSPSEFLERDGLRFREPSERDFERA
jgi:hypothetical protein